MSGNITGSLQTKKGYYYAVVNLIAPDGGRKQRWIATGFPEKGNKRRATQKMREIIEDLEAQNVSFDSSLRFWEVLELWLEASKLRLREATYRNYKTVMDAHILPYFKKTNIKVRDLKPMDLEAYYRFKLQTLSPVTVQKHHANIYSALEYARKNKIVNFNAAKDAWCPARKKRQVGGFYTMEQIARLKEVIRGETVEVPLMLIASYGFRRSEVLGLKWDAVDFEQKTITIRAVLVISGTEVSFVEDTKSSASKRTLPMSDELAAYLKQIKARQAQDREKYGSLYRDDGFVCVREDGTPIHPAYLTRRFKRIAEKNGLPVIRLHDLRHSAATNLLAMGFSVKDVSVWLGHADVTTTLNIYSHVLEESKEDMANALWSGSRTAS